MLRIAAAASAPGPREGTAAVPVSASPGKSQEIHDGGRRCQEQGLCEDGASIGVARPALFSRITITDIVLPLGKAREGQGGGGGHANASAAPSPRARTACFVDLPPEVGDAVTECDLSTDGRRLAAALPDGSVATWLLPPLPRDPAQASTRLETPEGLFDRAAGSDRESGGEESGGEESEGHRRGEDGGRDDTMEGAPHLVVSSCLAASPYAHPLCASGKSVEALGRPEVYIAHLLSPEEKAHEKAVLAFDRVHGAAGAGAADGARAIEGGADGDPPRPPPPPLSTPAYHLAHVRLLPELRDQRGGSGGDGGGLAVWRSRSNVWRLYRLPPTPPPGTFSASGGRGGGGDGEGGHGDTTAKDQDVPPRVEGGLAGIRRVPHSLVPILDAATLRCSTWVLPSPVTCSAATSDSGGPCAGHSVYDSSGGSGQKPLPLVAIGTEDGLACVCDGGYGIVREGMSRHRRRVTALAFYGRRWGTLTRPPAGWSTLMLGWNSR